MVSLTSGRSQLATFEFTGSFQNTTRNTPTSVAAGADSTSFDLVNLATKNINNTTDNNWVVQNWNQGSSIDSTEYAYFRISAESGFLLNLTQLNFQSLLGRITRKSVYSSMVHRQHQPVMPTLQRWMRPFLFLRFLGISLIFRMRHRLSSVFTDGTLQLRKAASGMIKSQPEDPSLLSPNLTNTA